MHSTDRRPGWAVVIGCLLAGVAIVAVAVPILARTAAIAMPAGLAQSGLSPALSSALWDLAVVYGPAVGLPALLLSWLLFRWTRGGTLTRAAGVLLAAWFTVHALVPLAWGETTALALAWSRPWWAYGYELALLAGIGLALLLERRRGTSGAANGSIAPS